jgi:hypothetical protein
MSQQSFQPAEGDNRQMLKKTGESDHDLHSWLL